MPVLYYAKDGRRPDTQRGEGIRLTFDEIAAAFGSRGAHYLSKEPPEINPDKPSRYPVNVIIEVEEVDGTNEHFPKVGFYLLKDLTPEKAHQLLAAYHGKK